jgi:hypothetical protein
MTSNIITPSNTKAFCLKICKCHKTSLTPPPFIEVSVSSHGTEQSCICVLGVSIFSLSTIFLLDVGIVPIVWYIFVFLDFRIVPTVRYIFVFLDFRIVPTVWYIFVFLDFRIVPTVWCIFVFLDFGIVLTVWYIFVFHFTTIRIRHSDVYLL